MSTTSAGKTAPMARSGNRGCCDDPDCESRLRNRYFFGKQLSPYSFQVEQEYSLERRRLLNRAIHGWGVVYGFELAKTSSGALLIKPGLALDENGRELLQVEALTRAVNELIVLNEDGQRMTWSEVKAAECWLLSVHYAEQDRDQVNVSDPCQCERMEWNYTCETVRYSLSRRACAECCKGQGCDWDCACKSPGSCGQLEDPRLRGGRRCLCDYVTQRAPGSERDTLCEIDEPCGSVRVDLRHGVPLACVKLVFDDKCNAWTLGNVDACAPRRLVKGNDLLFDLIQGCDLTHISRIGWWAMHRSRNDKGEDQPIAFQDFAAALAVEDGKRHERYVTRDFWVEFSRPVRIETLRPDCFTMTVISREREGGWGQPFRVPIIGVAKGPEPPSPNDPAGSARRATIVVEGAWLEDAVSGRRSLFQGGETTVEIEVRGDFIIDCNGQTVDANAVGLSPFPTGNGTPGGTFVSTFRVSPSSEYAYPAPGRAAEQAKGVQS